MSLYQVAMFETFGGNDLPFWAHNGMVATLGLVLVLWICALFVRASALFRNARAIKGGRVLEITQEDDIGPGSWLDQRLVTRLTNRRVEAPRTPMEGVTCPLWVMAPLTGSLEARTIAAAVRVAPDVAQTTGAASPSYAALYGMSQDAWQELKMQNNIDVGEAFDPCKAAAHVAAPHWTPFAARATDGSDKVVIQLDGHVYAGKHEAHESDIAFALFVRHDSTVLAVSCASDLRVLECVLWHGGFPCALSVRDTFVEGEDADCIVCCAELKNTVLLPCRHLCCCAACLGRMDKCPICRAPVESYVVFGERAPDGMEAEGLV